jgi:flagellar basal body-associated protein FliL
MSEKESAQNTIDAYRKRQERAQRAPLIIGIAAILLVIGAAVIIFWLLGAENPAIALFATETPTPTATSTATATATVNTDDNPDSHSLRTVHIHGRRRRYTLRYRRKIWSGPLSTDRNQ